MAPTALQARIAAFEALQNGDASSLKLLALDDDDSESAATARPLASPSTSSVPARDSQTTSILDLKDWVIEDRPSSPSSSTSRLSSPPSLRPVPPSRAPSNPPPRIHVGSPPRPSPSPRIASSSSSSSLSSRFSPAVPPAIARPPPLPPRKASSPTSTAAPSSAFPARKPSSPPSASPAASPQMLMLPEAEHSYPPPGSRLGRGHAQASSISSFHSVSLSSDAGSSAQDPASPHVQTFPIEHDRDRDEDADSLADSFEDVSTPSSYALNTPAVAAPTLPSALLRATKPPVPPPLKSKLVTRIPPPAPIPVPVLAPSLPPRLTQRSTSSAQQPSTPPPPAPSAYARRVPPPPPPVPTTALPYTPRQRTRSGSRPPSIRSSIQSTSTTATTATTVSSDRSSILSRTTSTSSFSHVTAISKQQQPLDRRLPPIPLAARTRYDTLFVANVRARARARASASNQSTSHLAVPVPKRRANAGWRGLSVDLIPADNVALLEDAARERDQERGKEKDGEGVDEVEAPSDATLSPATVKRIWSLSRLDKARLREIWDDCLDPARATTQNAEGLDREAFAKGLWLIDEELRKARIGGGAVRRGSAQVLPRRAR